MGSRGAASRLRFAGCDKHQHDKRGEEHIVRVPDICQGCACGRGCYVGRLLARLPLLPWHHVDSARVVNSRTGMGFSIRYALDKSFGASLQPSAFALIAMVMFTARYLEKYNRDPESMFSWRRLIFDLWGPVLVMAFLITFYNLSTGLIFMFTFYVVLLIGRYPVRHILVTIGAFIVMAGGLYGLYKAKPEAFEGTRMETWVARLERFFKKDETLDIAAINKMSPAQREDYNRRKKEDADKRMQENAARTAIALGGVLPSAGPGKSIQKYFLSEADSDFIFSILVEEYSFIGGAFILLPFCAVGHTRDDTGVQGRGYVRNAGALRASVRDDEPGGGAYRC